MFTLFAILNPFTLNRDHTNVWLQSAVGKSSSDQQWWKHQSGRANLHPDFLARCYDATTLKFQMMACKYFSIRLSSRRSNWKARLKERRRWRHETVTAVTLTVSSTLISTVPCFPPRSWRTEKQTRLTRCIYSSTVLKYAVVFFYSATHYCQVLSIFYNYSYFHRLHPASDTKMYFFTISLISTAINQKLPNFGLSVKCWMSYLIMGQSTV